MELLYLMRCSHVIPLFSEETESEHIKDFLSHLQTLQQPQRQQSSLFYWWLFVLQGQSYCIKGKNKMTFLDCLSIYSLFCSWLVLIHFNPDCPFCLRRRREHTPVNQDPEELCTLNAWVLAHLQWTSKRHWLCCGCRELQQCFTKSNIPLQWRIDSYLHVGLVVISAW